MSVANRALFSMVYTPMGCDDEYGAMKCSEKKTKRKSKIYKAIFALKVFQQLSFAAEQKYLEQSCE